MALLGTWTIALVSLVAVVFVSRFAHVDQQLEGQLVIVIERMELLEHKLDFSTQHLSSTIRDLEIKIHDLQQLQERRDESLKSCSNRVEGLELWNKKLEKENKKLNQTVNEIGQRLQNHVNAIKASNDKINSLGLADTELKMTDKKLNDSITKTAGSLEKVAEVLANLKRKSQKSEDSTKSSFIELKDSLTSYQRKEVHISCPPNYVRNPYSNTCLTLIAERRTYSSAKEFCEARGEYLATFETIESSVWFVNLRQTLGWRHSPHVLIGMLKEQGTWKWTGKITGLADTLVWGSGEPNNRKGRESCVASVPAFADCPCNDLNQFVCERLH
ncbi:C-type lectin domain family 4 member G-like [Watersipora subatra]|uniref:C-type lectin domain family 4 member G-like n=1 Tax=Watersipora subatra TaxID=2589382 RepID=UPI00355BED6C